MSTQISTPEDFFTAVERPVSRGEKLDAGVILTERIKAKVMLITADDGNVFRGLHDNDAMVCMYELAEQIIQLETILKFQEPR